MDSLYKGGPSFFEKKKKKGGNVPPSSRMQPAASRCRIPGTASRLSVFSKGPSCATCSSRSHLPFLFFLHNTKQDPAQLGTRRARAAKEASKEISAFGVCGGAGGHCVVSVNRGGRAERPNRRAGRARHSSHGPPQHPDTEYQFDGKNDADPDWSRLGAHLRRVTHLRSPMEPIYVLIYVKC